MKNLKTALLTFFTLALFSSSLYAVEYNGLGGVPANPREDNPRTESIFVFENAPGSIVEDGVVVINNTNETKTVLVYATDTTPSSDGGFACKQYAEEVTDEGTWFKMEQSEVILEAGKNIIVPFTVSIPSEVSVGEHNACVVIQEKKAPETDAGVNLSFRAAIRAMITIPGDIYRKLEIKSFIYSKSENKKNSLALVVSNSGNVSLDTKISVEVKNLVTSKTFFNTTSEYPILHSNEQTYNYDLDNNPWGGIYKAVVTLKFDGQNGPETLTKELTFVIVPTVYAIALYVSVLIILITAILLITGSKRKFKMAVKDSKEYIVKEGDTLNSIAKDHNVKWKLLAKINDKKAPFEVKVDERLKIPMIKGKDTPIIADNILPETEPELPTFPTTPVPTFESPKPEVKVQPPQTPVVTQPAPFVSEPTSTHLPTPTSSNPTQETTSEDIIKNIQGDITKVQ